MKNLKFYLIIAVLAILLTIAMTFCFNYHKEVTAYKASKQNIAKQIETEAKEVKRAVNEKGIESVIFDITDNRTPVKNVGNTDIKDIVDTAAMALDIQSKKLKEVTVIAAQYKAENIQLRAQLDSNKRTYYTYNGNGLNLKLTPPYDVGDSATADFIGRFGITIAKGDKAKWYSPWNRNLLSVTSDSPYFTVDHVNYIGFDKNQALNLSALATASYNKINGSGFGPGIKVTIGRLDLNGNYQYYHQQKKWMYSAGASFALVGL